uniref:G-protein coupled bile acid receptor 1 n=1 Tax=Scleropages formosus TaxID=113540 RepID=A0A8C9RGE5_SCLFO
MVRNDSVLQGERLIYCITVPMSTAIILANLLILLSFACNRQLHNTSNYFFVSLLVADLCTGVALPFIPWMGINRDLDFGACLLAHILPNFLFLSFLFNLVMVHYERYLCIVSPLHSGRFWVHRCFPLALLVVWAPPLLYASLPAFGWNNRDPHRNGEDSCSYRRIFPTSFIYLEVYGLLVPAILAIVGMTCRVLCIARVQLRDICKLHRAVGQTGASSSEHQLNLRYARCVAVVSLIFLACWVPYIAYVHVSVLQMKKRGGSSTMHIILSCTGIGTTAVIPVILGLANRQYTQPLRVLLCRLRGRCRTSPETADEIFAFFGPLSSINVELVLP